jgi:hypothetical protein
MNNFVFTALATTLVGATSFASDTAWPELESELAALNNAPLTQDAGGPYVNGWLIGALTYNSDSEYDLNTNNDAQGFGVVGARMNVSGSVGSNYGYKIGFDFTDTGEQWIGGPGVAGDAGLTDAYATFEIAEGVSGKMGAFRTPFLRSSLVDRNDTLFLNRSYLGGLNAGRDAGIALNGAFNRVNWQIAVQNGNDGTGEGWAYTGRVDMDVMGTSSNVEGGYNAAEGTNLNIGLAFSDDTSDDYTIPATPASRDAQRLALDATLTMSGFTLFAEMVDNDTSVGDNSPYSIGAAYLFGENYEAALRWDDYDTNDNDTRYTIGVNRYINGHDAKWQLAYSGGGTDRTGSNDPQEDSVLTIGLALGF